MPFSSTEKLPVHLCVYMGSMCRAASQESIGEGSRSSACRGACGVVPTLFSCLLGIPSHMCFLVIRLVTSCG